MLIQLDKELSKGEGERKRKGEGERESEGDSRLQDLLVKVP